MKQHEPPFQLKEMKLEVTHACPLACAHCSSDASPSCKREMGLEDCLRIIDEAAELGVVELAFSGGEPLIWDGLLEAIGIAVARGIRVSVYTSGNIPKQREMFDSLADAGVARCVFSLFAAVEQTHERTTRIKGSYARTLRAMSAARKAGMDVELHFVPMGYNYQQLPELAKLAKRRGVSPISVLRFVPQGRGQLIKSHVLTRFQNLQLKKCIEKLRADGHIIRTGSPYNFLMLNDQPKCCSGIDRLIIGPELHIWPCDAFKQIRAEEVVSTGDFSRLTQWSLGTCWQKSPFLNEVRNYLTTPFPSDCEACESLKVCLSGCLAQKVIVHGDFGKRPDPACLHGRGVQE